MVTPRDRYPVVAGIPYLREGREDLQAEVFQALNAGDKRSALRLLLRDQDDWSPTPPPSVEAVDEVIEGHSSLREAMSLLNFGPVGDYFAYRWSDPTFLSGLTLIEHFVQPGERVFELGCGIGQFLREFNRRGIEAWGADVVFAKLYLARRYVVPDARLICFDAASAFPLRDREADVAFCHDAFYFLPNKKHVTEEMHRIARHVLIGHTHNAAVDNYSAGNPLRVAEYAALLPDASIYDDAELTCAWLEQREPRPECDSQSAAAIALVTGGKVSRTAQVDCRESEPLQVNPLFCKNSSGGLDVQEPLFPSERYRDEYGPASEYLILKQAVSPAAVESAERGKWAHSPELRGLVRRRIFLSLPERW